MACYVNTLWRTLRRCSNTSAPPGGQDLTTSELPAPEELLQGGDVAAVDAAQMECFELCCCELLYGRHFEAQPICIATFAGRHCVQ